MTSKERIQRILKHQPVDRIGVFEHFWGHTQSDWCNRGDIPENVVLEDYFGLDMQGCWPFNYMIDLDFVPQVIEENEEWHTMLDGNGATLKTFKYKDGVPEHIAFRVAEGADFEGCYEKLTPDPRRINFDMYRWARQSAEQHNRFFQWAGINVFEQMHPVMGHENLLVAMAVEPEFVKKMALHYANLNIELMKILFEQEGLPDGIWFYEDMGYKGTPFFSVDMYREIIMPAHKLTFDYAHSLGLPVIIHSCGFVDPLVPHMIEAGMDCLQAIEVKAGMDVVSLAERYGNKIALIGGIDIRTLQSGNRDLIRDELEEKLPKIMANAPYILHTDHSLPSSIKVEDYQYFLKTGLEIGKY